MFDFDNSISTFVYKNFSGIFSSKIAKRQAFPKYAIQYNTNFTVTVHILVRSLAGFYRQQTDRHMNLSFMRRGNEREWTIW